MTPGQDSLPSAHEQGTAALEAGNLAEAVGFFRQAVDDHPRSSEARHNLALALLRVGRDVEAMRRLSEALALDPGLHGAAKRLSALLATFDFADFSGFEAKGLEAALAFADIDHQPLVEAAFALLKQCSPLAQAMDRGRIDGWPAAAKWLLSSKGRALLKNPLLIRALTHGVNVDAEIELLLTETRKALLVDRAKETLRKKHLADFVHALIGQCANNEFVYQVSKPEKDLLDGLYVDAEGLKSGSKCAAEALSLLALYKPLDHLLPVGDDSRSYRDVSSRSLKTLISNHMEACRKENEIIASIERIGAIGDDISRRVMEQYEANSYPRWLSLDVPSPGAMLKQLAGYFDPGTLAFFDRPFDLLVAGCGTGQQVLKCAFGYGENANLLAVDLSRASLAYAVRKAGEYGAAGIRFAQADILDLARLEKRFDVIECVGVLHHLRDPLAGWRVLVETLRPGGIMLIGLYSALARRDIIQLRREIESSGLGADDDGIRDFRRLLMMKDEGQLGAELRHSADFFTFSNFRDLIFHVNEHQLTIPEIKEFLECSGLRFRGFLLPPPVRQAFRQVSPKEGDLLDLDKWWDFEQEQPSSFEGMYVFWCYKS